MTTVDERPPVAMGVRGRAARLLSEVEYKPDYEIVLGISPEGRDYMQVHCWRIDSVTGLPGWGKGGKFYLSEHMTDQEIVQNAFGLFKSYEEHECREFFHFRGKRIYGPHISLDALLEVADRTTYRKG